MRMEKKFEFIYNDLMAKQSSLNDFKTYLIKKINLTEKWLKITNNEELKLKCKTYIDTYMELVTLIDRKIMDIETEICK